MSRPRFKREYYAVTGDERRVFRNKAALLRYCKRDDYLGVGFTEKGRNHRLWLDGGRLRADTGRAAWEVLWGFLGCGVQLPMAELIRFARQSAWNGSDP